MATPRGPTGPPCGPRKGYTTHALLPPNTLSVLSAVFLSLFKGVVIDSQDRSN
jgi:hypothetical protein